MLWSSLSVFRDNYKSSVTFISVPKQLVSVAEQLRKCSGAVSKSSVAVISLPEHLEVFRAIIIVPEQLVSAMEQLRNCS